MKIKTIITSLLLVFVSASLTYIVIGEYYKSTKGHTIEQEKSNPSALPASPNDIAQKALSPTDQKVIAYYFHGNARCPSCLKIESYTKENCISPSTILLRTILASSRYSIWAIVSPRAKTFCAVGNNSHDVHSISHDICGAI